MTTPQISIIVGDTVTDRDMNADELAIYKEMQKHEQAKLAAAKQREAARQAVLDKLGLTADEAAALLG